MCTGLELDPHRSRPETPAAQRLTRERGHHGESRLIHERSDGSVGGPVEGEVGTDEPDALDCEGSPGGQCEGVPASWDHDDDAAGSEGGGGESTPTES